MVSPKLATNILPCTNQVLEGSKNALSESSAFEEDPAFTSADRFDFVEPPQFQDILSSTLRTMNALSQQELTYVDCAGPFGVGKSRCAMEVINEACKKTKGWLRGYIRMINCFPRYTEEDTDNLESCMYMLALTLCVAFGIGLQHEKKYEINLSAVHSKFKADFGVDEVRAFVLFERFTSNMTAVRMLLKACAIVSTDPKYKMRVIPVFTGVIFNPNMWILPEGSLFRVEVYTLMPLADDALFASFAKRIGIKKGLWEKCGPLMRTLKECSGYPWWLERLVEHILRLDDSKLDSLRKYGIYDVSAAQTIYNNVLQSARAEFRPECWVRSLFPNGYPGDDKYIAKQVVRGVILDVLTGAKVRGNDPIRSDVDKRITYKLAETSGMIGLRPVEQNKEETYYQVTMPMVAILGTNQNLKIIGEHLLDSSLDSDLAFQEESLALASLQIRVLHMSKNGVQTCQYQDLRPEANWTSNYLEDHGFKIIIPEFCEVFRVRNLFTGRPDLRMMESEISEIPPAIAGTFMMSENEGEKSIGGVGLFRGILNKRGVDKPYWVLLLFWSKYRSKTFAKGTEVHQPSSVDAVIKQLDSKKANIVKAWLGKIDRVKEQVVVLFDIHTNLAQAHGIKLPNEFCACSVTPSQKLVDADGPMSATRGDRKRSSQQIALCEEDALRKRVHYHR